MLKRKHKNIPRKAPETLWLQKSFDFTIPRSLEECCTDLEHLNRGGFSSYDSLYLSSIDQKQLAFHVCKSARRVGSVWAVGYLQSEADRSVRIVGKAGLPAYDLLLMGFIYVVLGLIFGLGVYLPKGVNPLFLMGIYFVLIGGISCGSLIWLRESLIDDLKRLGQRTE